MQERRNCAIVTQNTSACFSIHKLVGLKPRIDCGGTMKKGTFTDPRDGKEYNTVKIGGKVWMAENLAFEAPSSKYYKDDPTYKKYGRLYDWETAIKACPPGWHLPSNEEWDKLITAVGKYKTAKFLKATSGWNDYNGKSGNGIGTGFSALPGGGYSNGSFFGVGECGGWWSASEDIGHSAYYRYIGHDDDEHVFRSSGDKKSNLFSVRYLKDGGCYVATCVYGSYDCPEVWTLRRFRDNELSSSWFGRIFIRIYYAVSPKIVELFGNKKWFNVLWKPIIDKIVCKLRNRGIDSSPYLD